MSTTANYIAALALAAVIAASIGSYVSDAIGQSFSHLQTVTKVAPH